MKITVIVPSYNRADLLPVTLQSIFQQTLQPHEIIVVDDESTDGTVQMLEGLGEKVKTIPIKNSGEIVARNVGIKAATGDLIAFCDNDDIWKPNYLESMVRLWAMNPELLAGYCNFQILREGQIEEKTKFDDAPKNFLPGLGGELIIINTPFVDQLLKFQPLFPSAMVVNRRKFIALGGWDEGGGRGVGSDFATALLMAAHPPIGICSTPFVLIRKHRENQSGDAEKMNLADATILEYVLRSRVELAPLKEQIRASIDQRRTDAFNSAFSRRDFKTVREIDRTIGSGRSIKHRIKTAIATVADGL